MAAADMDFAPSPSTAPALSTKEILALVYIIALVVVAVLTLFLLHVLGSLRRRSSNKTLHAIVLGAYTLSCTLSSYTIGLMNKSNYGFIEFPVWAVCLLMLLGGTDNLMAYGLNDVDNWKSFYVRHLIQGALVVSILAFYGGESRVQGPLWAILAVNALQSCVRIKSMRMASKSHLLSKSVKPIADYMRCEDQLHVASGQRPNPVTMEGYRYVVAGERRRRKNYAIQPLNLSTDKVVEGVNITTVDQVWQCTGSLLSSKRGLRLKDVCLSMALSKMLNRRFAGYVLAEAGLEKTHDFVFRGLLAGDEPYERAFRVIGVELGFVYDLYYTRYPYLYHKARYFVLCLPMAMVILCSWLTYVLLKKKNEEDDDIHNVSLDTTVFLMAVVTFLEAFQLYLHMASGWFKVALIQSYVTRQSSCLPRMIIGLLLRLKALRPWEGKLGQYSLLQDYDGTRRTSNCLHYMTLCLVDKAKKGRKRGKLVKLSRQVKQAIIDSLLQSKGHLTNGTRSLQENSVHNQLSWACNPSDGMVTHTILVWHIATTICTQLEPALDNDDKQRSEVASNLSKYCAYLAAFAPDLLPDHSFDTESMLDESIEDARNLGLPRGAKKMKSKCEELMKISGTNEDGGAETLIRMGGRLARQLTEEIQEPALRWKVLADFWAEMMLYAAPCEDARARAHLEALARGGEFITHLWALLTHAGVLKRGPAGPDVV